MMTDSVYYDVSMKDSEDLSQVAHEVFERTPRGEPSPGHDADADVGDETESAMHGPQLFLNRELTWLSFTSRVLCEAENPDVPLLERVKFLAIVGSNLDEFIMKRIGGLKQQAAAGVTALTADGRTPEQQIRECFDVIRDIEERQSQLQRALVSQLAGQGIRLVDYADLLPEEQKRLRDYYYDNIFPLVTPQTSDPAHPFPFISNLSLNLLVSYVPPDRDDEALSRIKVPVGAGTPRFVRADDRTFVPLESVIAGNLDLLLPDAQIAGCSLFRVTRNAITESDEESADDLLAMIETELRDRRFAPVVRLEVSRGTTAQQRGKLAAELQLDEEVDVFDADGLLSMRDLMELAAVSDADLHDEPFAPVDHPVFTRDDVPTFYSIRDHGPLLVHHPYQSYATSVERFVKDAAADPKVRAIKMTLYRTDHRSKIIDCLIDAARNGKQVTAVVELKARFEEAANVRWANRLEEAGIHVIYGVIGLKTHCKVILVLRQDFSGLRRYAHIGTGNYNADTARLYTDVGLFTDDPMIGQDLTELFNYLTTGHKPRRTYVRILPSPKHCKAALLEKIEREISWQQRGEAGRVRIKTNALEDVDLIRAIYRASLAGVAVDLIVRDSCCLRPGVEGLSENVRVVSVIGRFLEHSRIYEFRNGGDEEVYVGSADCMKRNLESRVEVLAPVPTPGLRKEVGRILDELLSDTVGAWRMLSDGRYERIEPAEGEEARSAQAAMVDRAAKHYRQAMRLKRRRPRSKPRRGAR